jgi:hypothetical protein
MTDQRTTRRATLKDVAIEAGVSVATADRVVNGREGVRDKTVRRVEAAIGKLGYRSHAVAMSVANSRSYRLDRRLRRLVGRGRREMRPLRFSTQLGCRFRCLISLYKRRAPAKRQARGRCGQGRSLHARKVTGKLITSRASCSC